MANAFFKLNKHLCALLLALASSQALAQSEYIISYSYYLVPCDAFLEHRETGLPSDESNTANRFYVAGWLSAYNRLKSKNSIPQDMTLDDVMHWLERHCRDDTTSNLETGLFRMTQELPRTAPAAPKAASAPEPASRPGLKLLPY